MEPALPLAPSARDSAPGMATGAGAGVGGASKDSRMGSIVEVRAKSSVSACATHAKRQTCNAQHGRARDLWMPHQLIINLAIT